jgi:hypothetical protein
MIDVACKSCISSDNPFTKDQSATAFLSVLGQEGGLGSYSASP